jgi:hypothetical protein
MQSGNGEKWTVVRVFPPGIERAASAKRAALSGFART